MSGVQCGSITKRRCMLHDYVYDILACDRTTKMDILDSEYNLMSTDDHLQ